MLIRLSEAWYRAQSGLILPDQQPLASQAENDEYLALVTSMAEDFAAGRVTDLLIDDRDIKKPDNFIDFYFGPPGQDESSNPVWRPFPKQIQAATNVLQEHCTNTAGRMMCTDTTYVENIPTADSMDQILNKVTFLKHGRCPTCGKTRMDQWNEGNNRKELLAMAIGQRAGKDQTIGFIGAYLHACYLTLRNLGRAYRIAEGTTLYTTFTATTHGQAFKATFGPFAKIIRDHPWFKRYHEMLDYSGQKAGKELYKIGQETIVWPHHGLAVTVEAPHEGNLRGNAKIYGSITEYAYFYSKTKDAVKLNGPAIFDAMNNSFGTIKIGYRKCIEEGLYDMPPYLFPIASSPRTNKDGIMNLYRQSKVTKTMYGMHCSTFEFNPDAREEDFVTNRAANMDYYRTSILALPADAIQGFIKSRRLVTTMVDDALINAAACKSVATLVGSGMKMTTGDLRIRDNKSIDKTTPKVLGMDAGLTNNSFSGVIAHVEISENEITKDEQFVTVVDAVFEVIPFPGLRINYRKMYEDVILPICRDLNVQFVVADRWESTQFIDNLAEDITEVEVTGRQYKCTYNDFLGVRGAVEDNRIIVPKCEVVAHADPVQNINHIFTMAEVGYPQCFNEKPVAHLLYQLLTVEDLAGKTVDKGENSTDDTFRALVLAHTFCHDPDVRDVVLSGLEEALPDSSGFDMVSVALDGRVLDKKIFKPQIQPNAGITAGGPADQPFGIIATFKSF